MLLVHAQNRDSTFSVDVSKPGAAVAPIGRGQQIEEFNYQFQGGLYAQLINNPSFEELKNPIARWGLVKTGSAAGILSAQTAAETGLLNSRQSHCLKLAVTSTASGRVGVANGGYWGLGLRNETTYRASFWAKQGSNFSGAVRAALESDDGTLFAQSADFIPASV